jgi:hypothetical protein
MPTTETKKVTKKMAGKAKARVSKPRVKKLDTSTMAGRMAARVAIAKDVLKQLSAKKIKIKPLYDYGYFDAKVKEGAVQEGDDLQLLLKSGKVKECRVCALGAAFMSYVNLYDGVRVGSSHSYNAPAVHSTDNSGKRAASGSAFLYYSRPDKELETIFDYSLMDRIEQYYENGSGESGGKKESPDKRLRKAMQNIIDTKGDFTLPLSQE